MTVCGLIPFRGQGTKALVFNGYRAIGFVAKTVLSTNVPDHGGRLQKSPTYHGDNRAKVSLMLDMFELADISPLGVRPITREEYNRLIELGWFEDERVELLRGMLVTMSPHGPPHAEVIRRLNQFLVRAISDRAIVQIQSPIAIGDHSEPEPDIAIVETGNYSREYPQTAFLVIEVADSSLRKDKTVKPLLYASADIDEYWIINLPDQIVEVYRTPTEAGYSNITRYRRGESLTVLRFPDISIEVNTVLP